MATGRIWIVALKLADGSILIRRVRARGSVQAGRYALKHLATVNPRLVATVAQTTTEAYLKDWTITSDTL